MSPITGVKWGFANQTMHTSFSTQPAKCELSFKVDSSTLNSGYFTTGQLYDLGFKSLGFAPAQIHSQKHICPVLGFGPSRPRLDIKIGTIGIHLTGKHTAKFKYFQLIIEIVQVTGGIFQQRFILLLFCQCQYVGELTKANIEATYCQDNRFKCGPFFPKLLGIFRVIPYLAIGEFKLDLNQAILPGIIVKGTPSGH